ncbi:hypothetical protein PENSOL_c026G05648 [Penicillium solitum]|uniref:Uncharacterized protein n=1 Tax=Penicillium solitum TaxID=60172 RepID=A0A1V6QZM0_9EURO|nr:uncharacterized protein PENSOL_c026G05648 [Penicillium solitum]OQD94462.1 hypothetical protein PENSOL_c026G05648 [Penicillium solitum]
MKNAVCINRRQNKTNNRVRFKEYVENVEKHQARLNNRQPYTGDMVSESSVISQINNQSTEQYSGADSMLTPESCLLTPDCPQSPVMPSPFLSNPLNGSPIDHKLPLSSPTAFESYFERLTWEACDFNQIDGMVQDSIGPLMLHAIESRPTEGFSPVYEENTVIYNKSPFSGDPDLLLSTLNAHIFMGCAPLEMGLDSKNDDTR